MIYSRVIKDHAAGDQHSWLKPVTFSLSSMAMHPTEADVSIQTAAAGFQSDHG